MKMSAQGTSGSLVLNRRPVYHAHKISEIEHVTDMDTEARCIAYENTY